MAQEFQKLSKTLGRLLVHLLDYPLPHRMAYRVNILMSRWPLIEATSGVVRPISKKRLMASWRRSWKWRSGQPARRRMRSQASLRALEDIGNTISPLSGSCCRTSIALRVRITCRGCPFCCREFASDGLADQHRSMSAPTTHCA